MILFVLGGNTTYEQWSLAEQRRRDALEDLRVAAEAAKPKKRRHKRLARERFLRSSEWLEAREACFERLGRLCLQCGSADQIQVDHIKPRSKFPELALVQSNLRPLCWPCNKAKAARVLP